MGGGCEVERGETSDKFCLSYFVTRLNTYNTLCPGLNSVAAVARIPGPFIAHQRDDGPKTVLLEQVYTAYSQLVIIGGLWHGLKETSNQRRCPDFHLHSFDLGLQFWLPKRGCQIWSPTKSQKLLTSNPASVHAQIL